MRHEKRRVDGRRVLIMLYYYYYMGNGARKCVTNETAV